MAKKPTKKSIEQLQKFFDLLGESGGRIITDSPETWGTLVVDRLYSPDDIKTIRIGILYVVGGNDLYNPEFCLTAKMKGNRILEAEIESYGSASLLGWLYINGDDTISGLHRKEKDPEGLQNRFSSFMEKITEQGPYLTAKSEYIYRYL